MRRTGVTAGFAVACVAISLNAQPLAFKLRGTVVTPDETFAGELVMEGDTITCVAAACSAPPGAVTLTLAHSIIVPGLIDAHNHVAYNVLGKFTPPHLYQNRGQWERAEAYKVFKRPYADLKDRHHLYCEMVKWGELRALISGVTTVQGTSPDNACFDVLVRNAENENDLGVDATLTRTFILDIRSFHDSIDWTRTKSFVVHLGEGIDATSRAEFRTLKQKHLLKRGTAIIHGTAFADADFQEMGQVGAKLIWSPQSNLALYGKTTNIPSALARHVTVSIGVDWNPTGSDTIFDELRVAAGVNTTTFHGAIAETDWLPMVTTHPAQALALDQKIGRLASGFKADVAVLRSRDDDPSRSLLKTTLADVDMVWIGGKLLYGETEFVERVRPDECEPLTVSGSSKRICVPDTFKSVVKANQTYADLKAVLQAKYSHLAPLSR